MTKIITCEWCAQKIEEESSNPVSQNDSVIFICDACFENSSDCNNCDTRVLDENLNYVDSEDVHVCDTCYENDYLECVNCGRMFRRDRVEGGICDGCYGDGEAPLEPNDSGRVNYRNVDTKSTKFISEDRRKITSFRTFGIELEMVNSNISNLSKLSHALEDEIGVENDGSIGGGFGIEIQTPVLSGVAGEKLLEDVLKKSKECGFRVNRTCGTHCHLGASEFVPKYIDTFVMSKGGADGRFVGTVVDASDMDTLRILEDVGVDYYKIGGVSYGKDFMFPTKDTLNFADGEACKLKNTTFSKEEKDIIEHIVSGAVRGGILHYIHNPTSVTGYVMSGIGSGVAPISSSPSIAGADKYVAIATEAQKINAPKNFIGLYSTKIPDNKNLELIKTLMAFYVVFDDVFLSMLSSGRRNNRFCAPIKNRYAINEIVSARDQSEFDQMWYKHRGERGTNGGRDAGRVEERKMDGHDSSRYVGVNFHSLLGKNGTLEIRYHGGTLDLDKILSWVALHQKIMDTVARKSIVLSDVVKANMFLKFEDKLKAFFNLLQLSENLRSYVEGRINTYNK